MRIVERLDNRAEQLPLADLRELAVGTRRNLDQYIERGPVGFRAGSFCERFADGARGPARRHIGPVGGQLASGVREVIRVRSPGRADLRLRPPRPVATPVPDDPLGDIPASWQLSPALIAVRGQEIIRTPGP